MVSIECNGPLRWTLGIADQRFKIQGERGSAFSTSFVQQTIDFHVPPPAWTQVPLSTYVFGGWIYRPCITNERKGGVQIFFFKPDYYWEIGNWKRCDAIGYWYRTNRLLRYLDRDCTAPDQCTPLKFYSSFGFELF